MWKRHTSNSIGGKECSTKLQGQRSGTPADTFGTAKQHSDTQQAPLQQFSAVLPGQRVSGQGVADVHSSSGASLAQECIPLVTRASLQIEKMCSWHPKPRVHRPGHICHRQQWSGETACPVVMILTIMFRKSCHGEFESQTAWQCTQQQDCISFLKCMWTQQTS